MQGPKNQPVKPKPPGRPKGVPNKATGEIKAAAALHGADMIETLAKIAKDGKKPAATRVAAAVALLDRGYGKPQQSVQVDAKLQLSKLSDEELDERIAAAAAAAGFSHGS